MRKNAYSIYIIILIYKYILCPPRKALRVLGRKGKKEAFSRTLKGLPVPEKRNAANNFWQFSRKTVAAAKRKAPGEMRFCSCLIQGIPAHQKIKQSDCQNAVVVAPRGYVISDYNDFLE